MGYTMRPTDVLLKNVRLSYVRFDKAESRNPQQEKKYSCTILLPKSDAAQKQAIDTAVQAAIQIGREKFGSRVPAQPKTVIHDGDGLSPTGKEYNPEAKGHWVFTASLPESRGPVEVVDLGRHPILSQSEIYSGMFANVLVNFYFYANESMGIGAGLGPVQKVADGEPLGGRLPSADDVFGAPELAATGDYAYTSPPTAYAAAVPTAPAYTPPPAAYAAATGAGINPVTGAPM